MSDDDIPIKTLTRLVNQDGQLLLMADRLREMDLRLKKSEDEVRELSRRVNSELGHRQGVRDGQSQNNALLGWMIALTLGIIGIAVAVFFGLGGTGHK